MSHAVVLPAPDLRAAFNGPPTRRTIESLNEALEPLRDFLLSVRRGVAVLSTRLREHANDPVHVAGLEGRYQVRAALDPECDPDQLVRDIMRGDADGTLFLTPANRALVAAAACRGVAARGRRQDRPLVVWHRQMGQYRLTVCAA